MKKLDLSIIIPLFNDLDNVVKCLDSLKETIKEIDYEVIVVDNGSVDGGGTAVETDFPWARLIRNEKNLFFAKANNQGFEIAKGRYIATLNSDTEIIEDPFVKIIRFMDEQQGLGVASCPLYFPDGKLQATRRKRKNWASFLLEYSPFYTLLRIPFFQKYLKTFYYGGNTTLPDKEQDVDILQGALMVFRGTLLKKLGGFDETFKLSFTDDEICIRVLNEGYRVLFIPHGHVIHHELVSTKKVSKLEYIYWADYYYYIKKYIGGFIGIVFLYPWFLAGRFLRWFAIKSGIIDIVRKPKAEIMEK